MKELKYLITTRGYPSGSTWYYEPDPNTVSYVIQCVPDSTYTITLTEAGNRLCICTFTADPVTATGSLSGTSHLSINDPAVGYTYSVKPNKYGYLVFYMSNAAQYPEVSIVTDGAGGDDAAMTHGVSSAVRFPPVLRWRQRCTLLPMIGSLRP